MLLELASKVFRVRRKHHLRQKKNMSSGHKSLATPKKIRGDAELEADQRYLRSLELI